MKTDKQGVSGHIRKWKVFSLVAVLAGLLFVSNYWFSRTTRITTKNNTIAVLPFVNLAKDSTYAYFCEGITEAIIANLNAISDLQISSPATVRASFKNNKKNIRLTGEELQVSSILSGTVLESGNRLNVTVKLDDIPTGNTIWEKSYDYNIKDIFSLQYELAQAVVAQLHANLTGKEKDLLSKRPTQSLEAYDQFLQGRYYFGMRKDSTLRLAIKCFNKAISLDSLFSKAYSGLADSYAALGYISYEPPPSAFLKAEAAALKALELDSSLADPHTSLGYVKFYYYWDWEGAEREFRKAQEMNPRYALAYASYGYLLTARERYPEAKLAMDKALQLDPLSPQINTDKGFSLFYAQEYDRAIHVLKNELATEPKSALAHIWLGRAYQEKKMYREAISEYEKTLMGIKDWPVALAAIGYVYGISGEKKEAEKMLQQLKELAQHRYVTPYGVSLVYASLQEKDKAFEWLQKAFEERSNWLVWLKQDPRWAPLKDDPRYESLIEKVGLLKNSPPITPQ